MIVAMTIFFLMAMLTFADYLYYQNIAWVRLSMKLVSQSLSEARNLAINWYQINNANQAIGVIFDMNDPQNLTYVAFPYDDPKKEPKPESVFKRRTLERGVQIAGLEGNEKILILFDAITWESHMFSFLTWDKTPLSETSFQVDIAYKTAKMFPLKRSLKYFSRTNMIDY